MKVKILTDSGSGLSSAQANQMGVDYIPLHVNVGDMSYLDGRNLEIEKLYGFLENGHTPHTSQPPVGRVLELVRKYRKEEVDTVIYISLSKGLSGTNELVCRVLEENGIKVYSTDIYTTLAVQKYLVVQTVKLVQKGVHPQEIIRRIDECINDSKGWLVVDDMNFLARSGRLDPAAAKLAGMLRIIPVLEVSKDTHGKVGGMVEKFRSFHKAVLMASSFVIEHTKEHPEDYEYFVLDSKNEDNALLACMKLKSGLGNISIERSLIASVIAVHVGLRSVGIQYVKKIKE